MSYARYDGTGHYIWKDSLGYINFNVVHKVSDEEMSVFLYKIFLTRPEEFKELIIKGRDIVFNWLDNTGNEDNYKEWLLEKESKNEFFKQEYGLTKDKKEILKKAKGAGSSKSIFLNKIREELEKGELKWKNLIVE